MILPILMETGVQENTVSSTQCWAADKPVGMPVSRHLPHAPWLHRRLFFLPNAGDLSSGKRTPCQGTTELPALPADRWLAGARVGRQASGGKGRAETVVLDMSVDG